MKKQKKSSKKTSTVSFLSNRGKRFYAVAFAALFAIIGLSLLAYSFAASTGQIFISPSTSTVAPGQDVTVSLMISPGTPIDGVTANLTYDQSKLQFKSIDATGSVFDQELGSQAGGNGTVNISRVLSSFTCGVSADNSLIAKVTFTALAKRGSTTVNYTTIGSGPTDTNADCVGTLTDPAATGATITFGSSTTSGGRKPHK